MEETVTFSKCEMSSSSFALMSIVFPLILMSASTSSFHIGLYTSEMLPYAFVGDTMVTTAFKLVGHASPFRSATIHLPTIFSARFMSGCTGLSSLFVHAEKTFAPQIRMAVSIQFIIFFIIVLF